MQPTAEGGFKTLEGCFYSPGTKKNTSTPVSVDSTNTPIVSFDASLSNSIYGNSTTVQPKSLVLTGIIKY